jgi:ribonuclease E
VIDFIDMESSRNQREVEDRLRDSLRYDRARVQTAKISRFGLLELSRQRLAPSLGEGNYIACPRCSGIGHIRGIESSALHILRIIQEEAMKESSAAIHVQVPVDVATFLLNEKRSDIHRIESRLKVGVTLIPNPHLETPNYSINRLRQDDMTSEVLQASYKLVEKPAEEKPLTAAQEQQKATRAQAVVQGITPMQPAPVKTEAVEPSLLGRLFAWFKSSGEEQQPKAKPAPGRPRNAQRPERGERAEGGKRRGRGARGERGERGEAGERGEGGNQRERNEMRAKPALRQAQDKPASVQAESRPQEPRQPRPPRQPRTAEAKPILESQVPAAAIEQADESSPPREGARRRGRRGGRRERENREAAAQNGTQNASAIAPVSGEPIAAQANQQPAGPTEYIAYPDGYARPSEYVAMPTISTQPVPVAAPASLPAAAVSPVATAPVPAPARPAGGNGHDLIQIETDPHKLGSVAQGIAPQTERNAPRRRPRRHEVYVENEPLVQIETQQSRE